jgi:hypothetical protein
LRQEGQGSKEGEESESLGCLRGVNRLEASQESEMILLSFLVLMVLLQILQWRKLVSTEADLVSVATALATAANSLASTATAVEALVASLQAGTTQLVDQATLDSVNASLASSQASLTASQTALQALVPTTPPAGTPATPAA